MQPETLYNPVTGITATPIAGVTPTQTSAAVAQGFAPISSANLTAEAPLKLAETKPSTTASGIITSAESINNTVKQQTAEEARKASEQEKIRLENETYKTDLTSILGEQAGLGQKKINLQTEAGLPEQQKQINELTSRIEAQQLATRRQVEDINKNFQGTVQGKNEAIASVERASASKLADDAILLNALNRNFSTAQSFINQKIELETQDLKTRADNLKFFYSENKEVLSKAEQREFEKASKEADRAWQDAREKTKTLEETKLKYLNSAVSMGKDGNVLDGIQKATDLDQLAKIASANGVVDLDTELKRIQIEEKKADVEKTKAEASRLAAGGAKDDLVAYASQFSDTGKLPSPAELKQSGLTVGQVTMLAKQTKKPDGAVVSTNTGVKSSALSPAQEEGITAMSEIVRQTLPSLQEKFPKLYTGLLGGLGGLVYTTQDRQDYLTFRQEFINKLLKARSGATVTPQEYERYSALLPSTFNQSLFFGSDGAKKLKSLETAMKSSLDNTLNSNQLSIYGYSTVNVGDTPRKVGEVLDIAGVKYKVLPDGSLTDII